MPVAGRSEDEDLAEALVSGELRLSGRQLGAVPGFVLACCGLQVLDLSANSLTGLPAALGELKSLTDLDLSFNQLRELPSCVGQLTCLTSLRAQYNQIELVHAKVLASLGGCLVELVLSDNALAVLPSDVGCLAHCTRLELQFNRLEALPPQLANLAGSLQQLGLEGNPLAGPEQGACASRASAEQLRHVQACRQVQAAAAEAAPDALAHALAQLAASGHGSGRQHTGAHHSSSHHTGAAAVPEAEAAAHRRLHACMDASGASSVAHHSEGHHGGRHSTPLVLPPTASPGAGHELCSPLTGLRNTHADLELSYDEDDTDAGINIVGTTAGAGGAAAQPHGAVAAVEGGAFALSLSELAELPPAAAAALYRSMDLVASGMQELREGRPLSRGGTAAGLPLHTAPPALRQRPDTSGASAQGRRPRTGARPGSASQRPLTASGRDAGRPPSAMSARGPHAGGALLADGSPAPLTGAMALLAGSGMLGAQAGQPAPRPKEGGADADAGLGSMAPITFPLASGVRSMLRARSGGSARPAGEGAPACTSSAVRGDHDGKGPGAASTPAAAPAAPVSGRLSGEEAPPPAGAGARGADAGGSAAAGDATEDELWMDRLDVVRRLLASRNPELLQALDAEVFAPDGEDEAA